MTVAAQPLQQQPQSLNQPLQPLPLEPLPLQLLQLQHQRHLQMGMEVRL